MNKTELELKCREKADELIKHYFPNFIHEAAIERPEKLAVEYSDELPYKVESEFSDWLSDLWKDVAPANSRSYKEIMNLHLNMSMVDADYVPLLKGAREDAEKTTLWERITKSNHEDVTYYKGLLKEYTEKLLDTMVKDFVEETPD